MKIESPRFGSLEVTPDHTIEFPAGLVGLENLRRYSLFYPEGKGETPGYFIMQSLDDSAVAFILVDPAGFGCDYQIVLSDEQCKSLGVSDPADVVVAVMLLPGTSVGQPSSANIYGPLVINTKTRRALQVQVPRPAPLPRRQIVSTAMAPEAIGPYSQAVRAGNTVYMSGQIGLDPATMQMVSGLDAQAVRVFENLKAVAAAAGATLNDAVRFTIYLTDLANFAKVNEVMTRYVSEPYPARVTVGVKELPRGALVEVDAILVVG